MGGAQILSTVRCLRPEGSSKARADGVNPQPMLDDLQRASGIWVGVDRDGRIAVIGLLVLSHSNQPHQMMWIASPDGHVNRNMLVSHADVRRYVAEHHTVITLYRNQWIERLAELNE